MGDRYHVNGISFRPQSQSNLLDMLQAVLQTDDSLLPPSPSHIHPITHIDVPLVLLLQWGTIVRWSWVTWDDVRFHNSELVERMVSVHVTQDTYGG